MNPIRFFQIDKFIDTRGYSMEIFRDDVPEDMHIKMGYLSWTLPGMSRGPHEHAEQSDLFIFAGPGDFELRLWDCRNVEVMPPDDWWAEDNCQIHIVGQLTPVKVYVPAGVVHGYKNISDVPGLVINFPDTLYKGWHKKETPDECKWENKEGNPFVL